MIGKDTIRVCKLGRADAAAFDRVAPGVFDNDVDPEQVQAFLDDARHIICAAFHADQMVGMATGVEHFHPDKDPQLWVNEISVADDWQRRGIARRLLQALVEVGQGRGCSEAWLAAEADNAPARALYQAAGWNGVEGLVMYERDLD